MIVTIFQCLGKHTYTNGNGEEGYNSKVKDPAGSNDEKRHRYKHSIESSLATPLLST